METTKQTATFNVGGVTYSRKAKYEGANCRVIDCFGSANQKCKIEIHIQEINVDTEDLELTEMSDREDGLYWILPLNGTWCMARWVGEGNAWLITGGSAT